MKKKALYLSTLFLIAAFPFGNIFYKVCRGVSVSFFHSFERNASFAVKLPPLFQKYIHFYQTDFWIVALMIGALSLKEVRVKELFFNRHSRYLTFYGTIATLSILFSLFSNYYFQYVALVNLIIASISFHLVYLLLRKEKKWIPLALWAFIIVATLECLIGTGQFLMQKSLGLPFLGEAAINPTMDNIAVYPLTESSRPFFDSLPWIIGGHPYILRAHGTFDHPNIFGGYLVIALFVSYFLFIVSDKRWQRVFLLILLPFLLVNLGLTFSRGPFFAWALGTLFFFGVSFFSKGAYSQKEWKRFLHLSIWIGGGFLFTIALLFNQLLARGGFINYNTVSGASDSGRLFFYKLATSLFLHFPFFGIGFNGFALFPYETIDPSLSNPAGQLAHSVYLQIGAETGLAGILLIFIFLYSIVRLFFRAKPTVLTVTLGAIVFSFFLIGLVDHFLWTYSSGRLMLFIFTGLFAAAIYPIETPLGGEEGQKHPMSFR